MKRLLPFLLLIGLGCYQKPASINVTIHLIDSNHSLQISGFDKMIVDDIGRDTAGEAWQSLLPVYKMPADTEMKDFQNVQPGKYKVSGSEVIFTPDTPFKQGQAYFLRTFDYSIAKDAWDFIRKQKGKGSVGHKDLLFKY